MKIPVIFSAMRCHPKTIPHPPKKKKKSLKQFFHYLLVYLYERRTVLSTATHEKLQVGNRLNIL